MGRKKSSASVKLEMVPNSHLTTASVMTPGSTIARPVRKLARQRANSDFCTRQV